MSTLVLHSVIPSSCHPVPPLACGSFGASVPLFSLGLTVERTTMNLFSTSNQNGAPRQTANAVSSHPKIVSPPAPVRLYFQQPRQQGSRNFSCRLSHAAHGGHPSGKPSMPSSLFASAMSLVMVLCFA